MNTAGPCILIKLKKKISLETTGKSNQGLYMFRVQVERNLFFECKHVAENAVKRILVKCHFGRHTITHNRYIHESVKPLYSFTWWPMDWTDSFFQIKLSELLPINLFGRTGERNNFLNPFFPKPRLRNIVWADEKDLKKEMGKLNTND